MVLLGRIYLGRSTGRESCSGSRIEDGTSTLSRSCDDDTRFWGEGDEDASEGCGKPGRPIYRCKTRVGEMLSSAASGMGYESLI